MRNLSLRYISLFLLLFSCGQTPNKETLNKSGEELGYPISYVDKVGSQLLYSLKNNIVHQKEVRLWVNYEILTSAELIILKDIDSTSYLTKYHYQQYGNVDMFHVDSVEVSIELPSISASRLLKTLYELDLKKLVNQPDSIRAMIGDGITYTLEFRDSTYYGAISCNTPHEFNDINHQTFMKIIGELEKALSWKYEK